MSLYTLLDHLRDLQRALYVWDAYDNCTEAERTRWRPLWSQVIDTNPAGSCRDALANAVAEARSAVDRAASKH